MVFLVKSRDKSVTEFFWILVYIENRFKKFQTLDYIGYFLSLIVTLKDSDEQFTNAVAMVDKI